VNTSGPAQRNELPLGRPDSDYSASRSVLGDAERAGIALRVAEAVGALTIICMTESGALARKLLAAAGRRRIVAVTANPATYEALTAAGLVAMRLPIQAVDKHRQVRHVLSVALKSNGAGVGDLVVCAIGQDAYPGEANLIVVTEVEPGLAATDVTELMKLMVGIQPITLECALGVALKIGRAARRGKRVGATLMLGDSLKVLEGSRQLIPNPFQGHDAAARTITDPAIHDTLVELSKLDGAFVVRGDGFIQSAGVFLVASESSAELPRGLGARHAAAAAATARTASAAIVVSATDGNVRVFSGGRLVLRMDPDVEHGPLRITP